MVFIERLEQLRKEKKVTRKKLLADCKIGKNQYTYWVKHDTLPTPSILAVLARYFNVSPEYLSGESDDPTPVCPPDMEHQLLFFFDQCDQEGKLRIIQLAMNEYDRSMKEKTEHTEPIAVG